MAKKLESQLKALDFAVKSLHDLTQGLPAVVNYAMKDIANQVIQTSRAYIRGDEEPYNEYWEELWYEGDGEGQSTPKFNNKHRVEKRDESQPLDDTGEMAESIKILAQSKMLSGSKAWVKIGSELERAYTHEHGGENPLGLSDIPKRAFLEPAIESVKANRQYIRSLDRTIKRIVADVLKGKKKAKSVKNTKRAK